MMKSSVILSGTDPPPFEVVAGGEVFAVGAQYDHRHVAVLGGAGPRRVELVEELDVLRVGDLGPIERDVAMRSATSYSMYNRQFLLIAGQA
jgi:hypothetical protein